MLRVRLLSILIILIAALFPSWTWGQAVTYVRPSTGIPVLVFTNVSTASLATYQSSVMDWSAFNGVNIEVTITANGNQIAVPACAHNPELQVQGSGVVNGTFSLVQDSQSDAIFATSGLTNAGPHFFYTVSNTTPWMKFVLSIDSPSSGANTCAVSIRVVPIAFPSKSMVTGEAKEGAPILSYNPVMTGGRSMNYGFAIGNRMNDNTLGVVMTPGGSNAGGLNVLNGQSAVTTASAAHILTAQSLAEAPRQLIQNIGANPIVCGIDSTITNTVNGVGCSGNSCGWIIPATTGSAGDGHGGSMYFEGWRGDVYCIAVGGNSVVSYARW